MIGARTLMHCCRRLNEDSVFDMEIDELEIQGGYFQIQLHVGRRSGDPQYRVDWGDGTSCLSDAYLLWHNYTASGRYRVRLGRDVWWWRLWAGVTVTAEGRYITSRPAIFPVCWSDWLESCEGTYCGWNSSLHNGGVQGVPPPWGRSVTSTSCCYQACVDLEGPFPEWTDRIVSLEATFDCCRRMRGRIPRWPRHVTRTNQCYRDTLAFGRVPAWPEGCEEMSHCYDGCTALTGEIPRWPDAAKSLDSTYAGCTGLTGILPAWPGNVSDVCECYRGCTGLSGVWTTDPALLMPEEKLTQGGGCRCYDCVTDASDAVRAHFWDRNWGGLIPRPE